MGDLHECFPPGSGAWRVRFSWYALASIAVVVIVFWVTGQGVPVMVGFASCLVAAGSAGVGTWAAKRVELCITDEGVRYCNGFVVSSYQLPEIAGVELRRENGPVLGAFGIQLLTRGPAGHAPREYRLGTVPFASVGLPLAERQRLVAALARLLGDDEVASLRDWSVTQELGADLAHEPTAHDHPQPPDVEQEP